VLVRSVSQAGRDLLESSGKDICGNLNTPRSSACLRYITEYSIEAVEILRKCGRNIGQLGIGRMSVLIHRLAILNYAQ